MNSETLLRLLRLALRALEVFLQRRATTPRAPTAADKMVERIAPLAEKALGQVPAPAPAPAGSPRSRAGIPASSILLGAVAAGAAAYVVLRQQQRVRERYRPLDAHLPPELLEILAAPGGGPRLQMVYNGDGLLDAETGLLYPVLDGIPDFLAAPIPHSALADEAYLSGLPNPATGDDLKLRELVAPAQALLLGDDRPANAALAGAVASLARQGGWVLSAPCGFGGYEIEMARAYPHARIICVDGRWDALLEMRRQAHAAGLNNLYFARGDAALLPLADAAVVGAWLPSGLYRAAAPERFLTQAARVCQPGALVAGCAAFSADPLALASQTTHASQAVNDYLALLSAAGLTEPRVFRQSLFMRFIGVRG